MLIYPTIKMAPIQGLTGFGGGATGYLTGGGAAAGPPQVLRYLDRTSVGQYNNSTTKPGQLSTTDYSQGWGHSGGNADGLVINVSGSGTYNLYSISIGSQGQSASDTFNHTLYLRVETGSTTGSGTVLLNTSQQYSLGYRQERWIELVLPSEVTLNRGQSYFIGYGVANGNGFPSSNSQNSTFYISNENANTSLSVTTSDGSNATMTITDPSYGAGDPWDATNSTAANRGTLPIIGIKI